MQYRPITPQDTATNVMILAVFLALILSLLIAIAVFHQSFLVLILLLFCVVSVLVLTKWNIATHGFECPSCKHQFDINMRTAPLTPHVWNKKLLRCPACGKRDWAMEVVKIHPPK